MKTLNLAIFVSVLLLSQTACVSQPLHTANREPQVHELEKKIGELQSKSYMPGLQVLVTEYNKPIFEYQRGIRAEGYPEEITPQDQWHIGSCTKPMTAFLIGRLIDSKKITWKTTIGEMAPKDYDLHSSVRAITVEQLLSHSSGLADVAEPDDGKLWATLFDDKVEVHIAREKLVRGILKMPTRFQPGAREEYSNSGYVVLGWILEQKKNKNWETILRKEMFQKLKMNSCGFGPAGVENVKAPRQPWSHQFENNKLEAIAPGVGADNPAAMGPAGSVHCSVQDWHKFNQLFMNNEGVRSGFLKQSTYDKLLSSTGQGSYTFSTMARMQRPWAKGGVFVMAGSNTMNYAVVAIAPSLNRVFTINTNAGHAKAEESATEILKLLTELQ